MASPIGHSLAGAGIAFLLRKKVFKASAAWKFIFFCVLIANLPDFDIIPGIYAGDINRYHHDYTHTLLFAFAVSLAVFAAARGNRPRWAFVSLLLVLSHLLIDFATVDNSPPVGIPLLWPLSDARFNWECAFLPTVSRGRELLSVFNSRNSCTAAVEAAVFLPFAVIAYYIYRKS
jgi:inner membrane protein